MPPPVGPGASRQHTKSAAACRGRPGWRAGTYNAGAAYGDAYQTAYLSGTANTAEWTFSDLDSGAYAVYTTHVAASNHAQAAEFNVYDGNSSTGTLDLATTVNQRSAPNDLTYGGQPWELIGHVLIDQTNTLTVQLDASAATGEWAIADGVIAQPAELGTIHRLDVPRLVEPGSTTTATAIVVDPEQTLIDSVEFYRDNGNMVFDEGDALLHTDAFGGDGYSAQISTDDWDEDFHDLFAVALSSTGAVLDTAMATFVLAHSMPFVGRVPNTGGSQTGLLLDWYAREAAYDNKLQLYEVNDLRGGIIVTPDDPATPEVNEEIRYTPGGDNNGDEEVNSADREAYESAAIAHAIPNATLSPPATPSDAIPKKTPAFFTLSPGELFSAYIQQGDKPSLPNDSEPAGDGFYTFFPFAGANVDGKPHFQDNGALADAVLTDWGAEDLSFDEENHPNPAGYICDKDFDDVVFRVAVLTMDIDTDSDNDRVIKPDDLTEDEIEDNHPEVTPGKRIFANTDDDNENGKMDSADPASAYERNGQEFDDNDFAEIKLRVLGDRSKIPEGYEFWLGYPWGIEAYAGTDKLRVIPLASDPVQERPYDIPDMVFTANGGTIFKWEASENFASTLYLEGLFPNKYDVFWRLVNPATEEVFARDTVDVNVEKIVYPYSNQAGEWSKLPTDQWTGLEVADAWYIDKSLEDYYNDPADKGHLEAIHPDIPEPGSDDTDLTWASKQGGLSTSTDTYPNGFTMEFDYSFETSRGDGTWGYVRIDNNGSKPQKLSFVGNSGVKFGEIPDPDPDKVGKPCEAAILDVHSMVGLAEGLGSVYPDPQAGTGILDGNPGTVHMDPYDDEPLRQLMTGVQYGGVYAKMADLIAIGPADPEEPTPLELYDMLSTHIAHSNGHMEIDLMKNTDDSLHTLKIFVDGTRAYEDKELNITSLGTIDLQSHWGSGVIVSNMNVTKK